MSTFGDMIDKDNPEMRTFTAMEDEASAAAAQPLPVAAGQGFAMPEWLKAETGAGEVEEYITHPLNFNGKRSTARVIRGLTGMFGSLRYAMIDIVLGILEMGRERRKAAAAVEVATDAAS